MMYYKGLLLVFVFIAPFFLAQKPYKKISESEINIEKQTIAKNFIKEYFEKCNNKDYSSFTDFNLSKRFELFINENFEKNCIKNQDLYGEISLLDFNSAYINRYTENYDPLELMIFNVKTEKLPKIKYISVWVFRDKNYINGLWISTEKPLKPKKRNIE